MRGTISSDLSVPNAVSGVFNTRSVFGAIGRIWYLTCSVVGQRWSEQGGKSRSLAAHRGPRFDPEEVIRSSFNPPPDAASRVDLTPPFKRSEGHFELPRQRSITDISP